VGINTLVENVLILPQIPKQFIRLIMELFDQYASLFPPEFTFPIAQELALVCDLVDANPIAPIAELTFILAPETEPEEQSPETEPEEQAPEPETPQTASHSVTVRTSVCGAEFRFS
jgi:hypothetical protein